MRTTWQASAKRISRRFAPEVDESEAAAREEGAVAKDSWNTHIGYLEDEVKKIDGRAAKLEAIIPGLEDKPKQIALRELLKQLRDEASEHRKYLALVKRK